MNGMEKISEAILEKVKGDARNIVADAEEKARQEIEKAKKQREKRLEEEEHKLVREAKEEAARILAQASIAARQELVRAKTDMIDKVIDRVRSVLSETSSNAATLLSLAQEAYDALGVDKVRVYVATRDIDTTRRAIGTNKELAEKIVDIREFDCVGGLIVESLDGKMRIDNTYGARLEILLPKILPEVSNDLFSQIR